MPSIARDSDWPCLIALLLIGCGGGRTAMLPYLQPCSREGNQRACQNTCGLGTQLCQGGYWQSCQVDPTQRRCQNTCGEGTQLCQDDAWQSCQVDPVTRICSDTCGQGTQLCQDGSWGACTVPVATKACSTVCGSGTRTCQNSVWSDCDAPQPKAPVLHATLRDFHRTHPDFERPGTGDLSDPGIVESILGDDGTPTYAHTGGTLTVTSPETFAQWYHDVPGVNVNIPYDIALQASTTKPGFYEFDNPNFFPLDNDPRGFGDEGFAHDFDFTLATQFTFHYVGGEVFRFVGDDDLWVFVNRHLAIDLGGLHVAKTGQVYLDEHAAEFGISPGNTYTLHIFFAERHVVNSDFSIETTIADPGTCD